MTGHTDRPLLPPPSEVPKLGTGHWPVDQIHEVATVLNAELLRLLDAMPTEGHDTDSTPDGSCTVCGPHLAALEEHQRHRQMVADYLAVRARAAHWADHGPPTQVAQRSLAEAESVVLALLSAGEPSEAGSVPEGL